MSNVTIPNDITEVTPAWIESALNAGGKISVGTVASVDLKQIGEGVGIMGELYRAALTYSAGQGPASVIVKLPSRAEENRAQGVALGMYDCEVNFYQQIADGTDARIPRSYFAASVPGTGTFVILMEDLGHMSMVAQMDGMSPAQTVRSLESLAAVHASWWGKADAPQLSWVPSVVHERIQGFAQMWPALWEMFLPKFQQVLPEGGAELGGWMANAYWDVMVKFSESPWTLLHQDFRVDNLMFDNDQVAVIDWQSIGRGPAAYDLAYLLGGSVTVEARRENEEAWVRHYHSVLVDRGVDYSFDSLWRDYRIGHLLGGPSTAVLTGATFDLGNERGLALIQSMAQRHFTACIDLDSRSLVS